MDDRAQLMLIGAVVIAVAMLALVTVLNSTIYAQNVAPGNTLDETRETNEQLQVVERDVTRIAERLQARHGYVDEARLNGTLQVYARHRTEHTAWRSPAHVDVELNETTEADVTILRQDWERHLFPHDHSNPTSWQLVDGGNLTGGTPFEATLEPQDSGQGPAFVLENGAGEVTRVEVDPGDDEVVFSGPTGCTDAVGYAGETVRINVTAGTVDGSPFSCPPPADEPYDVSIEDGQHANGSYTVTVDEAAAVVDGNFADNRSAGNPYTTTPITGAVVDVRYGTGSVTMDTQVEVTPE